MSESWLYRLYCTESQDPEGVLLYVGISDSPSSRMGNHESQKWWWWLVDKIEWVRCRDREEAGAKESRAIASEHPLFNKAESALSGWVRLHEITNVLWDHSHNTWKHPWCPFCSSHGHDSVLGEREGREIFRRNCDDRLVIHFVVSCDRHGHEIQWAEHVDVVKFLIGFGKAPKDEVAALLSAGWGNAPWEDRMARVATLAEQVEFSGVKSLGSSTVLAIEEK